MGKNTTFFGQPVYGQLINCIDKAKILKMSREHGGERYIKSFDGWHHLLTMLYAVINRFDSLREIEVSMSADKRKFYHLGFEAIPRRSTLSDANVRRPEKFFEAVYHYVYDQNKAILSSDSRSHTESKWMKELKIIDSTTISLFSNLIFKGVGRHPKIGKKKGGIKVHTTIYANESVPCDVHFTSAATSDSIMFIPSNYSKGTITMDRAYIDYKKMEELSRRDVSYVTKMKKNLVYQELASCMDMTPTGQMQYREQVVVFQKDDIRHIARIITYVDIKKGKQPKLVQLLTNDFDMPIEDVILIYQRRWKIESLFKQIKQNFPLRYFYGESANAIKIQIWVTLIANLLLTALQKRLKRKWSFSGLATMFRLMMMRYVNLETFFENPEQDIKPMLQQISNSPPCYD